MADTSDDALTDMPDKVEVKATEFGLKVTVADGSSSWVQVDVDGKTPIAEVVTGPQELADEIRADLEKALDSYR